MAITMRESAPHYAPADAARQYPSPSGLTERGRKRIISAMKIVIYAGMGKTGSTTIQSTFAVLRQDTYAPAPPGVANFHNRLFTLCFSAADNIKDTFPNSGRNYAQMRRQPDEAIATSARPVFLFTSGVLADARERTLRRFAAYCVSRFDEIVVAERRLVPWRDEKRKAFTRALSGIGGDAKLRLAPQLVMPILER